MSNFSRLADAFLASEFELYPTRASALGVTEYDGRLEDLSASAFERRDAEAASDGLTSDERLDRDLAIAQLRGRTILADWVGWRRDPLVYSGPILDGIF